MKVASFRIAANHRILPLIDWYLFLFDIAAIARERWRGRLTCGAIKTRLLQLRGAPEAPHIGQAAALLPDVATVLQLDPLLQTICDRLSLPVLDKPFPWQDCRVGTTGRNIAPEELPWRMREEARFLTGVYAPVPWADRLPAIPDHFAHLSSANPGLIAFTDTAEKAEADLQTPIKPGRYLTRFYPDLAAHQVRDIQEAMPRAAKLCFASTADEIEGIYTRGPSSCMSHDDGHFESPCHPVRVYGGSDLQLAYITNKLGLPTARALIWPEKKRHGRTYGHESLLIQALEREGYQRASLCGARIRRIPVRHDDSLVVMPYIDDDQSFDIVDDDWLVIGGPYSANNTTGIAEIKDMTCCDRCEDRVADDETHSVNGEAWCDGCRSEHAFRSDHSDDLFPNDELADVIVCGPQGRRTTQSWSNAECEEHATYCEGSNQWYATEQFKFVALANGETWVDWYFAEHGKPGDLAADNDNPSCDGAGERAAA